MSTAGRCRLRRSCTVPIVWRPAWRWGAGRGDRVGLWLPKSLQTVTAIHGILRSGAAYVPVDPTGPALRRQYLRGGRSQGGRRRQLPCRRAVRRLEGARPPAPTDPGRYEGNRTTACPIASA